MRLATFAPQAVGFCPPDGTVVRIECLPRTKGCMVLACGIKQSYCTSDGRLHDACLHKALTTLLYKALAFTLTAALQDHKRSTQALCVVCWFGLEYPWRQQGAVVKSKANAQTCCGAHTAHTRSPKAKRAQLVPSKHPSIMLKLARAPGTQSGHVYEYMLWKFSISTGQPHQEFFCHANRKIKTARPNHAVI